MGKAYRIPTSLDRLKKQQIEIKQIQGLMRSRNTPRPVSSTAFAGVSAAGDIGGTGNFLRTVGDTMIGPLALAPPVDFRVVIDSSNTINIGESSSNSQYSSNIQLDSIQPNSIVLDIIAGAAYDGQLLVIRTFAPPVSGITISQATLDNGGNIQTPADADVIIGDLQIIYLVFDSSLIVHANTGGTWRLLNTFGGGATGIQFPIDFPEEDRGTVTGTQSIDFTQSDRHAIIMELDGDIGISLTNTTLGKLQITTIKLRQDGTGGHAFTEFTQTVANEQIIIDAVAAASDPGDFVVFIVRFLDGLFTAFLEDSNEISGGGGGLNTNLSNMVSPTIPPVDLNMNQHNILGVTGIDLDGATATIQGVQLLDLFQADQEIESLSSGIEYTVGDLQSHTFKSLTDDIAKFEESAAGVFKLNMFGNSIQDIGFLGSDAANLPGSGFIRMGTTEEIRMRNPDNTDDLIITSGVDTLGNQAIIYDVAGGVRLTISEFDMDVTGNDIVNTGDIIPAAGSPEVGLFDNAYTQMHSQFFVPVGAAIVTTRFGFAKNVNRLYVNYNNIDADAGFGIFEQGIQHFGFSNPLPNVHELFIGPDPFTSGEEYRIQLGENSNASGRISFIEGVGNDVLITRGGSGTDQGVQINSGVRFLSDRIRFLKNQDMNSLDITELGNIKSDGSATGIIGELLPDGGFDYFMRDTMAWDGDPAVKLTFRSTGITLETNGVSDDIDIFTVGTNSNIDINAAADGILSLGIIATNHLRFFDGVTEFSNANIFLSTNAQFISFGDAVAGGLVDTPSSGDINLFNNSNTGELSVKKSGGAVVSLEGGGFTSPLTTKGDLLGFDTVNARIPVGTNGQVLTVNSAVALGVEWAAAGGGANTALSNLDLTTAINSNEFIPATDGTQNLGGTSNRWANIYGGRMVFPTGTSINAGETNIVKNTSDDMQFNVTTGNTFDWTFQGGTTQMRLSSTELELLGVNLEMNGNILDTVGFIRSDAVDPADSGFIRMGNGESLVWESNPAGVDVTLQVNTDNDFELSGNLVPNGSRDIGTLTNRWNAGNFDFLDVDNTALFNGDVILGNDLADEIFMNGNIATDIRFASILGITIDFFGTTNNAISGSADVVPNRPFTYIKVKVNGSNVVIPAFVES